MMTISDIITTHYSDLRARASKYNNNSNILEPDEVLDNVLITAIQKYNGKDIEEEEGLQYIWRNLYMESKFLPKRENHNIVALENIDIIDEAKEDY